MFLHQAVYQDQNRYCAGLARQIHKEGNIQPRDELYVNTHISLPNLLFQNVELWNYYRLGCVVSAQDSDVGVIWVEERLWICMSSMYVNCLRCHSDTERIQMGDFDKSLGRCISIAAFTFVCPGNSTPHFFSSRTSAQGLWITYWVSCIAPRQYPSFYILVKFTARCMLDSSSITRPCCLAIVADMSKPYWTLVAESNIEIRLLPLPYMLP
jgi:hypothetical protein